MQLFANLKRLFLSESPSPESENLMTLRVALLVEAATFDDHYSREEEECIHRLLREGYDLTPEEIAEGFRMARMKRAENPDVFAITRAINKVLSNEQKEALMTEIWQVIYADGHISPEEDVLAGRLKNLLRLDTSTWQRAKLRAKNAR